MNAHATLAGQTAALADLAGAADPTQPVPTCPGWTLGDLVSHVGNGQRWAAELIRRKTPPSEPGGGPPGGPAPADAGPWLRESSALLIAAAQDAADAEVWTFLGPRPPSFWIRRMTNDLIVHRADAAIALGRPFEIDPETAGDVIGEGLDLIAMGTTTGTTSALVALRGSGRLLLAATDTPERWSIRRTPAGVEWSYGHLEAGTGTVGDGGGASGGGGEGEGDADVTVRGPVAALLLMFSRRRPPEELDGELRIEGDRALLSHWLDHTAF